MGLKKQNFITPWECCALLRGISSATTGRCVKQYI